MTHPSSPERKPTWWAAPRPNRHSSPARVLPHSTSSPQPWQGSSAAEWHSPRLGLPRLPGSDLPSLARVPQKTASPGHQPGLRPPPPCPAALRDRTAWLGGAASAPPAVAWLESESTWPRGGRPPALPQPPRSLLPHLLLPGACVPGKDIRRPVALASDRKSACAPSWPEDGRDLALPPATPACRLPASCSRRSDEPARPWRWKARPASEYCAHPIRRLGA